MLGTVKTAYSENVWGVSPPISNVANTPALQPATGPVRRHRISYRRSAAIAAAALAAAWLLWLAGPIAFITLQADHRTVVGQIERIRMADGSTVDLGGSSAIKT